MDPLADPVAAVPIEDLLAHREWVSSLARSLVVDHARAEDLEQEAWLAALEHAPEDARSPRGWLATVVRRAAWKGRRSESRRGARERASSRPEATPSTVDVVVQAETHSRVVRAVLDLDEPYRTTVLLRFFEDLPPREVARRMNAPVETVRARSRRALEQLAARLDSDRGGRRAWVAALLPIATAPVGSGGASTLTWTGGLLVTAKSKAVVLMALVILAALAVFAWRPWEGRAGDGWEVASNPPDVGARSSIPSVAPPPGLATAPPRAAGGGKTPGNPPAASAMDAPVESIGATVRVRFAALGGSDLTAAEAKRLYDSAGAAPSVRLVSDAVLSGGRMTDLIATMFGPPDVWQRPATLRFDETGAVLDAPVPAGRWRLFASRPTTTPWLSAPFDAADGGEAAATVVLERKRMSQKIRLVAADTGAALARAVLRCWFEFGDDQAFLEGPGLVADSNGEVDLPLADSGSPEVGGRAPTWWAIAPGYAVQIPSSAQAILVGAPEPEIRVPRTATIAGHAYLGSGKPAEGKEVLAGRKGYILRARVEAGGAFRLLEVPVGSDGRGPGRVNLVLVEDAATARVALAKADVDAGGTADVTIGAPAVPGAARLRGRVTTGGRPLSGVFAMAGSGDRDAKRRVAQTDSDGRFDFEGLAPGSTRLDLLLVGPASDDYRIETTTPFDLPPGDEKQLDFDLPDGAVHVTVLDDATGKPVQGAAAWSRPSREGADRDRFPGFAYRPGWAAFTDAGGHATLLGLPSGEPLAVNAGTRDGKEAKAEAVMASGSAAPTEIVLRLKAKTPR